MLNEGIVTGDARIMVKSAMLRALWKLQRTTPDEWEQAVFTAITDHDRDDVDWSVEDNQAGYYTWIKAFDNLIDELIDDGYVKVVEDSEKGRVLVATEVDPGLDVSFAAYPPRS